MMCDETRSAKCSVFSAKLAVASRIGHFALSTLHFYLPMNRRTFTTTVLGTSGALAADPARAAGTTDVRLFRSRTRMPSTGSKGIYKATSDAATGDIGAPVLAAETASPSFLEIPPVKKYLDAVGEMGGATQKGGAVSAFAIDLPSGDPKLLNQVSSGGAGPCHVNVDKTGQVVGVANYSGGSCASYAVQADGSLSEAVSFFQHEGSSVNEKRQKGPHAHSFNYSPDGRFAFVCDLGLTR